MMKTLRRVTETSVQMIVIPGKRSGPEYHVDQKINGCREVANDFDI